MIWCFFQVLVLVALTDRNTTLVRSRSALLLQTFHNEIRSGILKVVSPPSNIYPLHVFQNRSGRLGSREDVRLPYGNSRTKSQWQSKLVSLQIFLHIVELLSSTYLPGFDICNSRQYTVQSFKKRHSLCSHSSSQISKNNRQLFS